MKSEKKALIVPLPITFLTTFVIARAESPWRSTGSQYPYRPRRQRPARHDGLPRRLLALPPRNDKVCCHREGEARGDPLALATRTDNPARVPRDPMNLTSANLQWERVVIWA